MAQPGGGDHFALRSFAFELYLFVALSQTLFPTLSTSESFVGYALCLFLASQLHIIVSTGLRPLIKYQGTIARHRGFGFHVGSGSSLSRKLSDLH